MARLGGLGIFFSFAVTLACVPLLNNLVSQGFGERWQSLEALLLPATIIFLLGVYDDFHGLNAWIKTSVQVLAAAILYWQGFGINALSLPFATYWEFPLWLSFPLTALWVVGITNAFNLIDGIDGLAAGAAVFAMLSLFVTSLLQGHVEICVVSLIIAGAVMGFLRFNFNPASIFLGDSGSLFLGFMCAALSLVSAQKSSTLIAVAIPLVSFGLPIMEVGLSMTRRLASGAPVFQSDRRHIHHMLLARGLNQRQAAILLYAVCALFSLFGIMLLNPGRNNIALVFGILGVCIVLGVQHLRYEEFGALGQQLRRGMRIRHRALAVDLQIQHAATDLQQVANFDELSSVLNQLFTTSEFDCVLLEVHHRPARANFGADAANQNAFSNGSAASTVHLPTRPAPNRVANRVEWSWNWQSEKIELAEVLASPHFWSLRVPLASAKGHSLGAVTFFRHVMAGDLAVDLTKVCGELRDELSAAISRLETLDQTAIERQPVQAKTAQFSFSRS
ncbi:MAG: undecaprenyl/decaprenyl-phosphate alpha-N-acetylglucosaminyl 1-phosphate transferase [Acidobacteria bacterium]|nr:undecaprenyl/decaprenyl-phosphate alpha-N-acetylglucosaminyl 1-phosphate transferase [Acidobacteriota bacterium]MBI3425565.1 undecaprenyl/decaprenyl-phosphate alpha-N-acetylglucosaminyl 1-phosphate transferase [Acidobacteriota bacterium]